MKTVKKLLSLFDNDINLIDEEGNSLFVLSSQSKNHEVADFILKNENFDCNKSDILNGFVLSLSDPFLSKEIFHYIEEHNLSRSILTPYWVKMIHTFSH